MIQFLHLHVTFTEFMAGSKLINCLKIKPDPLHQSCFLFTTLTQKLIYDVTQWHTLSLQSIGY
jgi:hypothetical protein